MGDRAANWISAGRSRVLLKGSPDRRTKQRMSNMPASKGNTSPSRESQRPQSIETEHSSNGKTASPVFPQALGLTLAASSLRGVGGAHRNAMTADGVSKEEMIAKHMEMQERFDALQPQNSRLVKDVKKKKESYVRREVYYKSQISHIKQVLEKTVLCHGGSEGDLPTIKKMHKQIMANIDEMQTRRERAVEEHEKNLLRQFRSNIIEVEDRLKKEQSKEEDVAGVPRAWIEKTAQLSKDVDKHKEQV